MKVQEAVERRKSVRAFLRDAVAQQELAALLETAQRAPSGGNLQPWRTIAVAGEARADIVALARSYLGETPQGDVAGRPIYPPQIAEMEPYQSRRLRVAEQMYAAVGIERTDRPKRLAWFLQNFDFFGAPVGLFFVIDERMGHGQWAHMGMYMQTIALLAEERGWGTCMQECWAVMRKPLHAHFGLADNEILYCGMALGVPDPSHPANANFYSERAPISEVVQFRGF